MGCDRMRRAPRTNAEEGRRRQHRKDGANKGGGFRRSPLPCILFADLDLDALVCEITIGRVYPSWAPPSRAPPEDANLPRAQTQSQVFGLRGSAWLSGGRLAGQGMQGMQAAAQCTWEGRAARCCTTGNKHAIISGNNAERTGCASSRQRRDASPTSKSPLYYW